MTEKRFYIDDEHIKDNLETHNPFYVETYNEAKRFCELLNDLNQEVIDAEHYHTVVLENFKAISKDYNKLKEENEQLKQQKEVWKQLCCTNSNFNSILLHELDIAQEQGFKVSNPFKQFLEDRGDVE